MSADEKLKIVASAALRTIFASGKASTPISSFDLLTRVISAGPPPAGLLPGPYPAPRFRLTDLARFDRILESFAQEWDSGKAIVSRDPSTGDMTVLDVQLGHVQKGQPSMPHGKKRKRVVDEDADSAAGGAEEEEARSDDIVCRKPAPTTLDSLSKDMKEVYSLLQRGTARGRLLAEQASHHG